jgi:hypothetical protein
MCAPTRQNSTDQRRPGGKYSMRVPLRPSRIIIL